MTMSSIRLSPKHGLNPAIPICFFCNKPKNEILLPGLMKGDQEAPKNMVWDKQPCDECKGHMAMGVILISVDEKLTDDRDNPYRTGGWCVVKDDFIARTVTPDELKNDILKRRVAFIPDDAWKMMGLPAIGGEPAEQEEQTESKP
jgi:hypothetical protein